MKRIGVLLAAGRSKRMGRPKQLLPWPPNSPGKPLVAAAFDAIAGLCDVVVIVVGHEADAVQAALAERRFLSVRVDSGAEMIVSIKLGLQLARELDATADVFLHPADHPEVRCDTLEKMVCLLAENSSCAVIPTYRSRGGHPALISAALVGEIVSFDGLGGLRQFWLDHADRCVRVPVDDPGVVFDIDTQSDYDFRVE